MNSVEVPKELVEKIYKLIESVKVDGKLRKGTNETTKAVEKNEAQLVITAEDVNPQEVIMHLPVLCEEKQIPFVQVPSKSELGAAAGLPISTSSIAVVNPGDAKKQLLDVIKDLENLKKAESKGSKEEAKPAEEKKEEKPVEEPKAKKPKQEEPVKEKAKEKLEAEPTTEDPVEENKEEPEAEETAKEEELEAEEPVEGKTAEPEGKDESGEISIEVEEEVPKEVKEEALAKEFKKEKKSEV